MRAGSARRPRAESCREIFTMLAESYLLREAASRFGLGCCAMSDDTCRSWSAPPPPHCYQTHISPLSRQVQPTALLGHSTDVQSPMSQHVSSAHWTQQGVGVLSWWKVDKGPVGGWPTPLTNTAKVRYV